MPRRLSVLLRATVFTVLLTLPAAARAQVLYASGYSSKVLAYDPATGKPLPGFTPIENDATGLTLKGRTLYCANATGVGTYDAATGAPINARFITGIKSPVSTDGLAISGNTLFVSDVYNGTVSAYDAATGTLIKEHFVTDLARPFSLWVADEILYVSNVTAYVGSAGGEDAGTVHAYHAATGQPLAGFHVIHVGNPKGLLVANKVLYVASTPRDSIASVGRDAAKVGVSTIRTYHAATGAPINASFAILLDGSPRGMAILGHTLFFSDYRLGSVGTCDAATGKLIDNSFIKGIINATSLVLSEPASAP